LLLIIKIGEFSQINKITVKTLRLYDKLGILKPKFIDKFTGFRYYDSDQLLLVQRIISLKQIGFSLSEIASILEDKSDLLKKLEQKKLKFIVISNLIKKKCPESRVI